MKAWNYYTPQAYRPRGWLARQLRIQAEGLAGNLDRVWPDVRDSAWIGGSGEERERVPYWLDGFVPLAYLLDDADMITRAGRYIDAILDWQQPDGWICPYPYDPNNSRRDTWSVQLMSKVLTVCWQCTGDERIPDALYRMLKNYWHLLKSGTVRLANWDRYRWYEALFGINFLYARSPEPWLKELARMLREQGQDFEELIPLWKEPQNLWRYETHIVGLMMMLKSEAVCCDILGEAYTDKAERLFDALQTWNGTAVGLITGDECLSGIGPTHGTELCGVVEELFSFETLFAQTGDMKWLDRMDPVVFNALPAGTSEDMRTHPYLQFANVIALRRFNCPPPFRTNPDGCQLFAMDRVYGCCTSNHGQGWPKFALSAFAWRDGEVASLFPVPGKLQTASQRITVETAYPFGQSVRYTVEARDAFTFRIRIPASAEEVTVDGKPAEKRRELVFPFAAGESRVIEVRFEAAPRFFERPRGLYAVRWGPLVFSVPISYTKKRRYLETPYFEDEYIPLSDWNYAYCGTLSPVRRHDPGDIPFSESDPPVTIRAKVRKIDWGLADGYETVCAEVPRSLEPVSDPEEITLYPYGCAKLRMTELPVVPQRTGSRQGPSGA